LRGAASGPSDPDDLSGPDGLSEPDGEAEIFASAGFPA
jgi:hypothetical protein